jgi:hypothetical protein
VAVLSIGEGRKRRDGSWPESVQGKVSFPDMPGFEGKFVASTYHDYLLAAAKQQSHPIGKAVAPGAPFVAFYLEDSGKLLFPPIGGTFAWANKEMRKAEKADKAAAKAGRARTPKSPTKSLPFAVVSVVQEGQKKPTTSLTPSPSFDRAKRAAQAAAAKYASAVAPSSNVKILVHVVRHHKNKISPPLYTLAVE